MLLEINGTSYELHFGMKAYKFFCDSIANINADDYMASDTAVAIIWGGMVNAAYRQKKSLPNSLYTEVVDWVDGALFDPERQKIIEEVSAAMAHSDVAQKVKEQAKVVEEEEKKRMSQSTSTE